MKISVCGAAFRSGNNEGFKAGRAEKSGASLEALIKENDEEPNYGNDAENDEGCFKRIHLDTSIPSRR